MRPKFLTLVPVLALASASLALAEDAPATREDVAALREEVRELRGLLLRVLEVEENRLRGISEIVTSAKNRTRERPSEVARRSSAPEAVVEPEPERPSRPDGTTGTVTGRVRVAGASAATAFVYVEDIQAKLVRNKTVEVRQKDKKFVPSAIAVQRGTRVVFPNQDNIFHNVFSLTPGASFDLGTYRAGDKPGAYVFMQPGVIDVFCNLHSQMSASVLVVPNGHFAKVGADGRFRLAGVPAGKHKVAAWTPNMAPTSKTIEVTPNGEVAIDFDLEGRSDPAPHTDKHGMPYGSYR